MNRKTTLAAGAIAAALVFPAGAAAHGHPSPQSVAKHVRSADQALDMVETLVSRNQDAKAAIQLARVKTQMRAADRESARVARKRPGSSRSAGTVRRVARQHNENAEVLAEVVDEAGGALQVDIAEVATSELRGREKALSILTRLLDRLPTRAQRGIATAIASLSSDGGDEVQSLSEAAQSGKLSSQGAAEVQDAFDYATSAIERGVERLRSIIDRVPRRARPYLERAMKRASEQLQQARQRRDEAYGQGATAPSQAPEQCRSAYVPGC